LPDIQVPAAESASNGKGPSEEDQANGNGKMRETPLAARIRALQSQASRA